MTSVNDLTIDILVSEKETLYERMIDAMTLLSAPIAVILRFQKIIDSSCFCGHSDEK